LFNNNNNNNINNNNINNNLIVFGYGIKVMLQSGQGPINRFIGISLIKSQTGWGPVCVTLQNNRFRDFCQVVKYINGDPKKNKGPIILRSKMDLIRSDQWVSGYNMLICE